MMIRTEFDLVLLCRGDGCDDLFREGFVLTVGDRDLDRASGSAAELHGVL